jgi:hypothetical protein
MRHILTCSIDGQPTFKYEARGVVSQQQAENQAKRLYGNDISFVGYETQSDDDGGRRGWFW